MTTPTPEQLEELSLKCAKILGWKFDNRIYHRDWTDPEGSTGAFPPNYSTSYDAIMPEIRKLDRDERYQFNQHYVDITSHISYLDAEPWQLCEAFVRLKTEGGEGR